VYNLNYTLTTLGYNVEEKLYLGADRHRWLNATVLRIRLTDGAEVVRLRRRPPYIPRQIPGTHFVRGCVKPMTIMQLEGLGQLKNPMTSLEMEPTSLRLTA
jgi:hypothetical protein